MRSRGKCPLVDQRVGPEGIIKEGHVTGGTKSMMGGKGAQPKSVSTRLKDF